MTDTPSTARLTANEEAYVMAVFREVARIAARSRRGFDADDIAGDVALAVADQPAAIMAGYPDPVCYARQRARHAGISFDRRERSQRGEGARLLLGPDGLQHPGRRYLSADAAGPDGGKGPIVHLADHGSLLEVVVTERLATGGLLHRCFAGLSAVEVHEVWLIDGCGYTVQELAASCGQRRETVSRRLNRARTVIRQNHAAMSSELELSG